MAKKLVVFSLILVVFSVPSWSWAATLYLEPAEGSFYQSETLIEEIKLDTQDQEINAIKVNLTYPKDILEVVDFSDGGSVLKLWVKRPDLPENNSLSVVSFSGGIPNGYKGDGLLGKIIFKVHESTQKGTQNNTKEAKIEFLDSSQVLLNDGFGTPAKLTTKGAVFKIFAQKSENSKDKWQGEIEKDNIPPESFRIVINKDPLLFDGKYFITFWTIDNQSGIDHYEVKEGKGEWLEAVSPYLLKDQSLKSIIKVKAVDKAGNERIETLKSRRDIFLYWITLVGLILVMGLVAYQVIKKRAMKKKLKSPK